MFPNIPPSGDEISALGRRPWQGRYEGVQGPKKAEGLLV